MKRSTTLLLAAIVAVAAAPAFAVDIVVQSSTAWGKKHDQAVARVGGSVVWKHAPSGTGLVRGEGDDFYAKLVKTKAFKYTVHNVELRWQPEIEPAGGTVVDPTDDDFYPYQWPHLAIDSEGAWAMGCDGTGARVAVLDGGIYTEHLDLVGQIDTACSVSFVPGQAFNTDTGTFWHGTHVAGIVVAGDNDFGTVGVAPGATVMGVKVLHGGSGGFDGILAGILYAADPELFGGDPACKADILNMSLGIPGGLPRNLFASRGEGANFLAIMTNIINYAARQDVLVVTATGNEGVDFGQAPNYVAIPAQLGNGIAVSATAPIGWMTGATNFDEPASYTNYGEELVWVSAPGGDFNCFTPECDLLTDGLPNWVYDGYMSTIRGSDNSGLWYSWASGTSMAAPTASGVAALMKAANPALTRADLKELIKDTAWDSGAPGNDEFHGHGFVNAANACAAALAWTPPLE
jgi:subtilisin family serine protease